MIEFFGDDVVDVFEGFVDFFEGNFPVDGVFLVAGLDSLGDVGSVALTLSHGCLMSKIKNYYRINNASSVKVRYYRKWAIEKFYKYNSKEKSNSGTLDKNHQDNKCPKSC